MTTRRQFVQTTGLVMTAAPLASVTLRPVFADARHFALERFVFDSRFAAAGSFAADAADAGVPVASFAGDLTDLWYHDLDLAWRRRPETLGGATTEQGLFVLETLAMDRRMRVAHREAGPIENGERLWHWVIAPRTARA